MLRFSADDVPAIANWSAPANRHEVRYVREDTDQGTPEKDFCNTGDFLRRLERQARLLHMGFPILLAHDCRT